MDIRHFCNCELNRELFKKMCLSGEPICYNCEKCGKKIYCNPCVKRFINYEKV